MKMFKYLEVAGAAEIQGSEDARHDRLPKLALKKQVLRTLAGKELDGISGGGDGGIGCRCTSRVFVG